MTNITGVCGDNPNLITPNPIIINIPIKTLAASVNDNLFFISKHSYFLVGSSIYHEKFDIEPYSNLYFAFLLPLFWTKKVPDTILNIVSGTTLAVVPPSLIENTNSHSLDDNGSRYLSGI